MQVLRVGLVVVCLCGVQGVLPSLSSASEFTFRFQEGQTLRYEMTQTANIDQKVNDQDISVKTEQRQDLTRRCKGVKENVAEIGETAERITMKLESPFLNLDFDSNDDKPIENDPSGLAKFLKAFAGSEIEYKLTPRGELRDIQMPEKLIEAINENPALKQMGWSFTADGMKAMMGQINIVWPEKTLAQGDEWDSQPVEVTAGGVKSKLSMSNTYEGMETKDGRALAKISRKVTMELTPPPGLEMTIESQDCNGTLWFDPDRGVLVESTVDQTLEMKIVAGGQTVRMTTTSNVEFKLKEGTEK